MVYKRADRGDEPATPRRYIVRELAGACRWLDDLERMWEGWPSPWREKMRDHYTKRVKELEESLSNILA